MVAVRSTAPVVMTAAGPVTVTLDAVDALSVGLSLQALARQQKTPPGTREIYQRVGQQLAAAARAGLVPR